MERLKLTFTLYLIVTFIYKFIVYIITVLKPDPPTKLVSIHVITQCIYLLFICLIIKLLIEF